MSLNCKVVGLGVLLGAAVASVGIVSSAQAASMNLGSSGWKASWDSSFDDASGTFVTLTVLAQTADTVVLQKTAAFTDGPDQFGLIAPIEINFEQTSASAVKNIVITSESVWNATGYDWNGFKFIIEDGNTGDSSLDVHYDLFASFGDDDPFNVNPFTTWTDSGIAGLPQVLEFGGGIVANGSIWRPGVGPNGGEVVIIANPSADGIQRFVFKEQPIPIPLPAAAWMGLSSLAGLGVMGAARRIRKTVA